MDNKDNILDESKYIELSGTIRIDSAMNVIINQPSPVVVEGSVTDVYDGKLDS